MFLTVWDAFRAFRDDFQPKNHQNRAKSTVSAKRRSIRRFWSQNPCVGPDTLGMDRGGFRQIPTVEPSFIDHIG